MTWLVLRDAVSGRDIMLRLDSLLLARPGPLAPTIEGDRIETTRVQFDVVGEYIDVRETVAEILDLVRRILADG
jgi:hypothetical protein